jgi:hypothetical protein
MIPSQQLNQPDGHLGLTGRFAILVVLGAVSAVGVTLVGLVMYLRM